MRKFSFVWLIALALCFLAGYAAYQTAVIVRDVVLGPDSDCQSQSDSGCRKFELLPKRHSDRR